MSNIESLYDLFELVGCKATFYDLGRHIVKMTPQEVIQFDRKQQAYPYPFRQQASMAVVLQPQQAQNPPLQAASTHSDAVIWFIRLPIDEKGKLNLGTRDHLIKSIVDKIVHKGEQSDLTNALEDNPYAFQPDPERMACFHAKLSYQMNLASSSYLDDVLTYLKGELEATDTSWQQLGLQGIADLAVRAQDKSYRLLIEKALSEAPMPVALALAKALEHELLDSTYLDFIVQRFKQATDSQFKAALIRAVSRGEGDQALSQTLQLSLICGEKMATDAQLELIVAVVAKCPHWLAKDAELLRLSMENLAQRDDGFAAFNKIATELTHTPAVHGALWALFRDNERSARLAQAISSLFTKTPQALQ